MVMLFMLTRIQPVMETYKITFYREDDKQTDEAGNIVSQVVEFMSANETTAMQVFQSAEPFAIVIKIEQV